MHDLSDQTRVLVRREVDSALRETWDKAKRSSPAAGLLAASAVLALFATASAYRLSLRWLEKRLSPPAAALTATIGYGVAAACTGTAGIRLLRQVPLPVPAETVRETADAVNREFSQSGG
ncbi:MAG: phage holin family protein [Actinobacteria bacterium]|nr:phage holin family protein [Actinomycetota bacterium]